MAEQIVLPMYSISEITTHSSAACFAVGQYQNVSIGGKTDRPGRAGIGHIFSRARRRIGSGPRVHSNAMSEPRRPPHRRSWATSIDRTLARSGVLGAKLRTDLMTVVGESGGASMEWTPILTADSHSHDDEALLDPTGYKIGPYTEDWRGVGWRRSAPKPGVPRNRYESRPQPLFPTRCLKWRCKSRHSRRLRSPNSASACGLIASGIHRPIAT